MKKDQHPTSAVSEQSQASDNIADLGVFDTYFRLYGGWHAVLTSYFFWAAAGLTLVCIPVWVDEDSNERVWLSMAVEIIPSLMAFSLGGMAILLAFSSQRLMDVIQQNGRADSLYMKTTASFFHFILLQTLSLVFVFLTSAYSVHLFSGVGFFLMAYGLLVAIAIAGNLLRLAQQFNLTAANYKTERKPD